MGLVYDAANTNKINKYGDVLTHNDVFVSEMGTTSLCIEKDDHNKCTINQNKAINNHLTTELLNHYHCIENINQHLTEDNIEIDGLFDINLVDH